MSEDLKPFQARVQPWMEECFGPEISADVTARNHRFLEEALELVQAKGCTAHEAHQLVDYVFGRDDGDPHQEVGGVMVTLAALCLAGGLDMHKAAEDELERIWTKVEQIRAKQAAKPKNSPLPQAAWNTRPESSVQEAALFDRQDWYWRDMDPDDSGDSAHEALRLLPDLCVSMIRSSMVGPTRFAFRANVLDPESDDTEVLHFATEEEARAAAEERRTALRALAEKDTPDE